MKNLSVYLTLFVIALGASSLQAQTIKLSDSQALEIGKRIWKNECAGTISGLTSWNKGEDFPSLGIAHFIWYPAGRRGPFEESFPGLVQYLDSQGVAVPSWLKGPCPWPDRQSFMSEIDGNRLKSLRTLLANSVGEQARFAALRLEKALPKMLEAAPAGSRDKIRKNFYRVAGQPMGLYALMDYVNFKGEGTSPTERYKGQGWGLLQVLETMSSDGPALTAFARSADTVLTRRVENSPPARNEAKWLPGWKNRHATYTK